eukprot:Seg1670.14 transcript_id=Seg1670.14/GoldUCD/mRNA.D3Y31 product=Poly protein_id=Seg1670.14/GoldUCD/D3Y31
MSACENNSKDFDDQSPNQDSNDNQVNDGSCKRKRTQISIVEYFSKRKKAKEDKERKESLSEEDMSVREDNPESKRRRELAAKAAEQRMKNSPNASQSCSESQLENDGASSSQDVDLSQSLFGMSPRDDFDSDSDSFSMDSIPMAFGRLQHCGEVLPRLQPQPDHTVLFRPHIQATEAPHPYPDRYRDVWDKEHVRMPCSKENLYPTKDKRIRKRWEFIEETLLKPIRTSRDFQNAVLTYNVHYKDKWDFEGWHAFCNQYLSLKEKDDLFDHILPEMVSLALRLPVICTRPPPLLKRQKDQSLTLSQQQAACFLANAFFCTFPRRNSQKYSEYSTFPDINFNRLFRGTKDVVNKTKAEKLKTLLHYFKRVTNDMPLGAVTYKRQVLPKETSPDWENCTTTFQNLHVQAQGTIEDDGNGFLQVDFANRLVGGGVIGEGCVQEEIRFLICPELILSRLFVERLDPNECLIVRGAERFSHYTGYAQTYKWHKEYVDLTPRDRWGRRNTEVVAMDAHVFNIYAQQFKQGMLKRELNKAYCAFYSSEDPLNLPAVATGNWGCGAFGGDARLKALIQLMAASHASRNMVYFTFNDKKLSEDLRDFHDFLKINDITIRDLWKLLQRYERELKKKDKHIELYPYLKNSFSCTENETEEKEDAFGEKDILIQVDMETEPVGCAPGEAGSEASPDYRNETP